MQQLKFGPGSAIPQLGERHQPSGLNSRFSGDQLAFAEYVSRTRDMLGRAHGKLGTVDRERVIDGNAPFELKPQAGDLAGHQKNCRRGVLLTHGLTDSPYFMHHLATFFQENGFHVMAILLPGHGTQPGDLLDTSWREWARAVAYGADRLAEEVDEVYLAGHSAGGALSIFQSLRDKRVRGLFLFSPALKITPLAALANLHKLYSWLIPSTKWVGIKPDLDIYKYESFPMNAAAQAHALIKELSAQLRAHKLDIPVFTVASEEDVTVNTPATLEFMVRARHPSSKLVLYTTHPEKVPTGFPAGRLELVNSVVPDQKILGSAHTAIVLPADDAHYGASGAYSNCVHYYPDDMKKYSACMAHSGQVLQGELTGQNLETGILRRLMYNPNFAALKISMKKFIDGLS